MKLLIVEDSVRLRETLNKGFSRLGYSVDTAEDGKEALNLLGVYQYDVVILDLMLPIINGYEVLKLIRQKNYRCNVIILSARDDVEDKVRGLTEGADDYLAKPFSFDELCARVAALGRRNFDLKSPTIMVGGVSINQPLRQASVNDKALALTPTEYGILEYLALNKNRVLTFEQLENSIYKGNVYVSKNTVETHISSIRKKLKEHGVESLIKTRRGFGYLIEHA